MTATVVTTSAALSKKKKSIPTGCTRAKNPRLGTSSPATRAIDQHQKTRNDTCAVFVVSPLCFQKAQSFCNYFLHVCSKELLSFAYFQLLTDNVSYSLDNAGKKKRRPETTDKSLGPTQSIGSISPCLQHRTSAAQENTKAFRIDVVGHLTCWRCF